MNFTTNVSHASNSSHSTTGKLCFIYDKDGFEIGATAAPEVINVIINAVTALGAILGNLLVLVSIWRTHSLHSPANILLCGLALSDLGNGIVVQPLFIAFLIGKIAGSVKVFCFSGFLARYSGAYLIGVSLMTLTAISVDKFISMKLHLRYRELVTNKRVALMICAIWVYNTTSIVLGLLKIFWGYASVVVVCLCIGLMIFSYSYVYRVIKRHQAHIDAQLQAQAHLRQGNDSSGMVEQKKSSFTMFLVCCIFILSYLPYVLIWILKPKTRVADEYGTTALLVGSCINPVLYGWRLEEIRVAIRKTLRKYCSIGNDPVVPTV